MKKIISYALCTLLIISFMSSMMFTKANADVLLPEITFVGVEHSPLVEGDTETLYITSKNADKVQYRAFLYSESTKSNVELTSNYSAETSGNIPYSINISQPFKLGKYIVTIYVKKAGTLGIKSEKGIYYDNKYTAYLNCVTRDNSNRVYATGKLNPDRDTFALGERVKVDEIRNISGMKGPYKYKLHALSVDENKWYKDITNYDSSIEWLPAAAGNYVLDIWATSSDSKVRYEAWKVRPIIIEDTLNISNDGVIQGSSDIDNPQKVSGSVSITGMNSSLNNMVIEKNLYILSGNTTFNNIKVNGKIIIDSGYYGEVNLNNVKSDKIEIYSPSTSVLNIKDSNINTVNINSKGTVNINLAGMSVLGKIVSNTDANINNKGGVVSSIDITDEYKGRKNVSVDGTIESLNIYSNTALTSGFTANIKNVNVKYSGESIDLRGKYGTILLYSPAKINLLSDTTVTGLSAYSNFDIWLESSAKILNLVKNGYSVSVSGLGQIQSGGSTSSNTSAEPVPTAIYPVNDNIVEVKFDKSLSKIDLEDFSLANESQLIPILEYKIKSTDDTRIFLRAEEILTDVKYSLFYKGADTKLTMTYKGSPRTVTLDTTPRTITVSKSKNPYFYISNTLHNVFDLNRYSIEISNLKSSSYPVAFDFEKVFKGVAIYTKPGNISDYSYDYSYEFKGSKWGEDCSAYINMEIDNKAVLTDYTMTLKLYDDVNDKVLATYSITIKVTE